MEFNTWGVIAIIALALGIIVSNLLLLKHSAKMKWPSREDIVDPVAKARKELEAKKKEEERE